MAKIDTEALAGAMVDAAKGVLTEKWPEAQKFAESEAKKFAQSMEDIALWKAAKQITQEQAKALCGLHQRSMKMVFTSLEGISLAMAEKAVNAALDAIRKTVNLAIGWAIL